jgi:four helix bundle protein
MAKIARFEDLQSWQRARELVNLVYDLTQQRAFGKDLRLSSQIQDAAGSVMHNIAEGFEAGTSSEFIRFLKIGRSASEVQSELYLALDRSYIAESELSSAYDLATQAKRLINGTIAYLGRSRAANRPRATLDDRGNYLTTEPRDY